MADCVSNDLAGQSAVQPLGKIVNELLRIFAPTPGIAVLAMRTGYFVGQNFFLYLLASNELTLTFTP